VRPRRAAALRGRDESDSEDDDASVVPGGRQRRRGGGGPAAGRASGGGRRRPRDHFRHSVERNLEAGRNYRVRDEKSKYYGSCSAKGSRGRGVDANPPRCHSSKARPEELESCFLPRRLRQTTRIGRFPTQDERARLQRQDHLESKRKINKVDSAGRLIAKALQALSRLPSLN